MWQVVWKIKQSVQLWRASEVLHLTSSWSSAHLSDRILFCPHFKDFHKIYKPLIETTFLVTAKYQVSRNLRDSFALNLRRRRIRTMRRRRRSGNSACYLVRLAVKIKTQSDFLPTSLMTRRLPSSENCCCNQMVRIRSRSIRVCLKLIMTAPFVLQVILRCLIKHFCLLCSLFGLQSGRGF